MLFYAAFSSTKIVKANELPSDEVESQLHRMIAASLNEIHVKNRARKRYLFDVRHLPKEQLLHLQNIVEIAFYKNPELTRVLIWVDGQIISKSPRPSKHIPDDRPFKVIPSYYNRIKW